MDEIKPKPSYESILADPKKLAKLLEENERRLLLLEKLRARVLGIEMAEEKKLKKTPAGSVWDEQEKNIITNEIRGFDPNLANAIAGERNKGKLVGKVDRRIRQIKRENKKVDKKLGNLKIRYGATLSKGSMLVEQILNDMTKIEGLYETEEKILKENQRIRDEIKRHIQKGDFGAENIDQFVALAKRMEQNNRKDVEIRKKIIELRRQLEELKKKGAPIEEEFVQETEEIRRRKAA